MGSNGAGRPVDGGAFAWLGGFVSRAWCWGCRGGLLVAIGTDDDDFEAPAYLAGIRGGVFLDTGAPERALEVGDGAGVGALLALGGVAAGGVQRGITLDIDVEADLEGGVVALFGAALDVVAAEIVQTEVGVGTDGGVEVFEGVFVSLGRGGLLSCLWKDA